jgi:C-terminal processing protease CtpA/Prc
VSITIGAHAFHPKIEAGMTAVDGGDLGPVIIPLTKLADGEKPTLEVVGIGVKLAAEGDTLRVDGVFPDGGGAAAGILPGDHIIAVDGMAVTTLGLDGAIAKIRGQVGTTVQIGIKRGDQVLQLVVERKKFHA